MPRVFKAGSYWIYFWSDESRPLEPVHVHIAEGAPKPGATEINNIEVLKGTAGVEPPPSDKTSMDVNILLNGVCDVNGVPLLKG